MLDEKDLQAIAQLMDKKLEPINARLDKLEAGQAGMAVRLDKLEAGQADMSSRLNNLEAKADTMKQELKTEISHEIRALIEVEVIPKFNLLADGHKLIVEQMAKKEDLDDAKEVIHSLLDVLKIIVRQHSEDIKELKKAQ